MIMILGILVCVAIVALEVWLLNGIFAMKTNRNIHAFPSVARCSICDNRVFLWQRKERRQFDIKLDNPDGITFSASGSSIVHKSCKGKPAAKVTVMRPAA